MQSDSLLTTRTHIKRRMVSKPYMDLHPKPPMSIHAAKIVLAIPIMVHHLYLNHPGTANDGIHMHHVTNIYIRVLELSRYEIRDVLHLDNTSILMWHSSSIEEHVSRPVQELLRMMTMYVLAEPTLKGGKKRNAFERSHDNCGKLMGLTGGVCMLTYLCLMHTLLTCPFIFFPPPCQDQVSTTSPTPPRWGREPGRQSGRA